ncbi:MAG: hypothetical protein K2M94_00825 [Paramuribaculum sp.]|nr:hypothetical protein [Paramuribaculum sp.]
MNKIIFIGECAVGVSLSDAATLPANAKINICGNIANAAIKASSAHTNVSYVSETARDFLGDMIISHMQSVGIDTLSIDRYTEGGATTVYFTDGDATHAEVIHAHRPDRKFDTVWPRIDPGDVVVFGNYFALDDRYRQQIVDLLEFATERKATRIYTPGFPAQCAPRITKVMPAILDYLDHSDVVITTTSQLHHIFSESDPQKAYRNHIRFHAPTAINLSDDSSLLTFSDSNGSVTLSIPASVSESDILSVTARACLENKLVAAQITSML